jgi:hypothetical protein
MFFATAPPKSLITKAWLGRESNPRHEDFQSSALPTELPSLFQGEGKGLRNDSRLTSGDGGKCRGAQDWVRS